MLVTGTILKTIMGKEATVVRCIHQGGVSDIYEVSYDQKPHAMRIYKAKFRDRYDEKDLYLLQDKISQGDPTRKYILWPCDMIRKCNEEYVGGYIMPLADKEFVPLLDVLSGKPGFSTYLAQITASIQLTLALKLLHSNGYCYPNLDSTQILVNPTTGELRSTFRYILQRTA